MSRFYAVALLSTLLLVEPAAVRSEEKPLTAVYDVTELLHRPGGRTGFAHIDEVARKIVSTIHPGGWGGATAGDSRLRELNGTRLEIHTTARHHKEIADLLGALRGLMDLDINLRAELFEIDRAVYEKELKPKFDRRPAIEVAEAFVEALRQKGQAVVTNALPVAVGKEARPFSVRQAYTFIEKARAGAGRQHNDYGVGFQGLTIRVTPTVSADRRYVSLKITQQATELIELKKRTVFDRKGEEVTIERPELTDTTTTATVEVGDGAWSLTAVGYLTADAKAKDRVLVLALRPEIYVAAEDKAIRGNNPK